jgi:2-iminoacetate synthase
MNFEPEPLLEPERAGVLLEIVRGKTGDRRTERRVERALCAAAPGLEELAALLSPAAAGYLEQMARKARLLTRKQFGRTIELYIPLYISNLCCGGCDYCGFASDRPVERRRLSPAEIEREISELARQGFDEVLLLTGERSGEEDFAYLGDAVRLCRRYITRVTVEAFPMETAEYARLVEDGLFGITIYQETYDRQLYRKVHRWGPKRDYDSRLDTPERALAAGARSAGLGVLLGLGEARDDLLHLAAHVGRLYRDHWQAFLSVSFPRLRPEAGGRRAARPVSDRELAQFVFAFRIAFPRIHLVLSTRESSLMRDNLAGVGISKMSVGSRTTVGGYERPYGDARQFELADERTREQFCRALGERGLMGVYKNWDTAFI